MTQPVMTRVWHGRTHIKHANEYLEYLFRTGVPDYKSTPGNLSRQVWRRTEEEACHFWSVTCSDSIESIKKFAGDDFGKARYYAHDSRYLLELEPMVLDCEAFDL